MSKNKIKGLKPNLEIDGDQVDHNEQDDNELDIEGTEEGTEGKDDPDTEDEDKDDTEGDDESDEDKEELDDVDVDWVKAAKKLKAHLENYSIEGYYTRMAALKLRPRYNDKEQRTLELYQEIMSL